MSVEWFRVNVALRRHPKYLLLRAKVGPVAMECLLGMWAWAAQARRDGRMIDRAEVEIAAEWVGPPGELHAALVAVGFLDPDGLTLHDWEHHNGRAISAMLKDRAASAQRWRERNQPPATPTATATATATTSPETSAEVRSKGNGSKVVASAEVAEDEEMRRMELRAIGQLPAGADTRMTIAFCEYQMTGGIDVRFEPFVRQVRAMEETGVKLDAIMAWFRANRGRHVHECRDALVTPPEKKKPETYLERKARERKEMEHDGA